MKRPSRQTAAENGSVPEVKRRRQSNGFFIEQLLAEPIEGIARANGNGKEDSRQTRTTTTTKRTRKGAKVSSAPEQCQKSNSPPLHPSNWLASKQPDPLRSLRCELDNLEQWEQFHQLGTEMIITKSGRRMFPVLKLRLSGTQPGMLYFPYLDLVPVEGEHRFRYAYNKSQWQSAGNADKSQFGRLFLHPDAPFSGEQLAQPGQTVCFDKAKLTNNGNGAGPDQLLLNSMHKYQARVHILCVPKGHPLAADPPKEFRSSADLCRMASLDYKTFDFEKTTFVAVTAYQNQLVTQKKIEQNPFAKGFRDQKAEGIDERTSLLLPQPKAPSLFQPTVRTSTLADEQPMAQMPAPPWPCWPWPPINPLQQIWLMAKAQQQRGMVGEGSGEEQGHYEDGHLDMKNLKSTKLPVE